MTLSSIPTLDFPIEKLDAGQKIEFMNMIYADLIANDIPAISPQSWHQDILDERQRMLEAGETEAIDFETFAAEVRAELQ